MYITQEGVKSEQAVVRPSLPPFLPVASLVSPTLTLASSSAARRSVQDHDPGDGRHLVAAQRRQVPQERGLRRRDRDGQPQHELEGCALSSLSWGATRTRAKADARVRARRDGPSSRRRRADLDARLPQRDARVQVRPQRQARHRQAVRPCSLSLCLALSAACPGRSQLTPLGPPPAAATRHELKHLSAASRRARSSSTTASSTSASSSASSTRTAPSRSSRPTASSSSCGASAGSPSLRRALAPLGACTDAGGI